MLNLNIGRMKNDLLLHKNTLILICLIAVFTALAVTSMFQKSPAADEAAHHIPTGYVFLKTGDFVYATDSPTLARYIAALPLLFMDLSLPNDRSFWAREDRAEFSREFLYSLNRSKAKQIIFVSRLPMVFVGIFGGIFLFLWVRKRYGPGTAIIASLFYFCSPNIIANARLATTDIVATVFIMCSVLSFWEALEAPEGKNILIAGVFLGLAMMSKYSALLLLPFYFAFCVIMPRVNQDKKNISNTVRIFFLSIFIALIVLWAGYAFEYKPFLENAMRPEAKVEVFVNSMNKIFPGMGRDRIYKCSKILYDAHIPLRSYILGVLGVLRHGAEGAKTFFLGAWSQKGHPMYYIVAFLVKTPVAIIISFILGVWSILIQKREKFFKIYLLSIIGMFIFFASSANLKLGLRYILPVYPFIFIIAALGLDDIFKRRYIYRIFGAILIVWVALIPFITWPDFLSYFNEIAGGPSQGYKYLRGSNLDWGQDLPALKEIMVAGKIDSVKLDYFGEADPLLYGINHSLIEKTEQAQPGSFVYAISANYLDKYMWSQELNPDAVAGNSIFIYDFRNKE